MDTEPKSTDGKLQASVIGCLETLYMIPVKATRVSVYGFPGEASPTHQNSLVSLLLPVPFKGGIDSLYMIRVKATRGSVCAFRGGAFPRRQNSLELLLLPGS